MEKRRNLFVLLSGLFAGRPFTVINLMVVPADCACICGQKKRKECLLRYGQKEKRMLLFVCFQRFFLLQLLFFSMGTDGYEPIKRFSADLKSYSVFLKSASI
jgi:hypothetical protein